MGFAAATFFVDALSHVCDRAERTQTTPFWRCTGGCKSGECRYLAAIGRSAAARACTRHVHIFVQQIYWTRRRKKEMTNPILSRLLLRKWRKNVVARILHQSPHTGFTASEPRRQSERWYPQATIAVAEHPLLYACNTNLCVVALQGGVTAFLLIETTFPPLLRRFRKGRLLAGTVAAHCRELSSSTRSATLLRLFMHLRTCFYLPLPAASLTQGPAQRREGQVRTG